MGLMDKVGYFANPFEHVKKLVDEWNPSKCKTEKAFENSLIEFLQENLEGKDVVKQYGIGRSKVDIGVDKKVFIELKKDLDTTAKLQRLLGQMDLYSKDLDNLLVVVCGKTDKNIEKSLREKVKDMDNSDLMGFQCSCIIKK